MIDRTLRELLAPEAMIVARSQTVVRISETIVFVILLSLTEFLTSS